MALATYVKRNELEDGSCTFDLTVIQGVQVLTLYAVTEHQAEKLDAVLRECAIGFSVDDLLASAA